MAAVVKVRKVGNSLGVILTKDVIDSLGVSEGDELFAVRSHEGIRLTPYDPDFAAAIVSTRDYMRRHKNALHELAKIVERRAIWMRNAFSVRRRRACTSRSARDSHQTGGTIAAS